MWLPLSSRSRRCRPLAERRFGEYFVPCSGGVDEDAGGDDVPLPARIEHQPPLVATLGPHAAGAGADHRAAFSGVHRIEHDEPRVVGKAIGIFERMMKAGLERQPRLVGHEIEFARAGGNIWRQPIQS